MDSLMKPQSFFPLVVALALVAGGLAARSSVLSGDSGIFAHRSPAQVKVIPLGEGEPWYGGKPSLAVRVESDVEGEIAAGEWVSIRLSIFTDLECSALTSHLRGIDGVEVVSEDLSQSCLQGAPALHDARVRVAEGATGMVAVDLTVSTEEGEKVVTRAIPIKAAAVSHFFTE